MVRKLILYVLTAVLAASSPVFAGDRQCEDCDLYHHGVHRTVVPTNDLDCIYFVQPHQANVLLRLELKDGSSRPYAKRNAGTHDHICVGRTWVQQATSASYICNDENHFNYAREGMIEALAVKPTLSHDVEACMFGRKICAEMGYPAYGDGN